MGPPIEKSLQYQLNHPHKSKNELLQWVWENRQALLDGLEYIGSGQGKRKGKEIKPNKRKWDRRTRRPPHAPAIY